jgi:hypothetical protein
MTPGQTILMSFRHTAGLGPRVNSREPAHAEVLTHFARSLLDPIAASEASE